MRWVIDTAPAEAHVTDVDAELAFAHNKIEENLSNYSAWHYRSQLLARRHNLPSQDLPQAVFDEERDTVTHAINVDPMDQSAWFYHRWLLGRREAAPCVLRVGVAGGRLFLVFNQNVQVGMGEWGNRTVPIKCWNGGGVVESVHPVLEWSKRSGSI